MTNELSLYSVHPSVAHTRSILNKLESKTGRTLEAWTSLLEAEGPEGLKERRAWLKSVFGLGGTTAALVAAAAEGSSPEDYDEERYLEMAVEYVDAMYGGKKEHLRPIHDRLLGLAFELGDDIRVSPCRTMVPIYRRHVIAQIKPSTLARVDLGLALKGTEKNLSDRLVDTGGLEKGDRITHRIPVAAPGDIDGEVEAWLEEAYRLNAPV